MVTGLIRILIRNIWGSIRVLWLRLQYLIWGNSAFEQAVFLAPPWLALKFLKHFGLEIGHGIDFHGRLNLHGTYALKDKLHVGEWCHIGPNVTLDLSDKITIESQATISLNVQIITHMDVGYSPLREQHYPGVTAPVMIKKGAYIGAGASILMGVTIGENSIVAAGALVREDVPAYTVVAGIPAKPVKSIEK